MANIVLSNSFEDDSVADYLRTRLLKKGHKIIRLEKDRYVTNIRHGILTDDEISSLDVIILIYSKNSVKDDYVGSVYRYLTGYATENQDSILIIPIIFDNISIPFDLNNMMFIRGDRDYLNKLFHNIDSSIDNFLGRRDAIYRTKKEVQEKIEKTAADYIEETISELTKKEKQLIKKANKWYFSGYISIIIGIVVAIIVISYGLNHRDFFNNLYFTIFISLKTFIIIGLLLTLSKYSFVLGKSFMNESLTNANRIHAISFGKFYLRAYGQQSKKEEIKDIFQHWNIEKTNDKDENLKEISPQLLEKFIELLKTVRK